MFHKLLSLWKTKTVITSILDLEKDDYVLLVNNIGGTSDIGKISSDRWNIL